MTYDIDDTRYTKQQQKIVDTALISYSDKTINYNTYKAPRGVFNLRHSRIVVLSVSWHQFPIM